MDRRKVGKGDKRHMEVGTGMVEKGRFGRKTVRKNNVRRRQ